MCIVSLTAKVGFGFQAFFGPNILQPKLQRKGSKVAGLPWECIAYRKSLGNRLYNYIHIYHRKPRRNYFILTMEASLVQP